MSVSIDQTIMDIKTVMAMKKRIENRGEYLSQNEIRTRYFLVDPMLRASGWSINNPDYVELEYSTWQSKRKVLVKEGEGYLFDDEQTERKETSDKVDYALMKPDRKPLAMIEAKRLYDLRVGRRVYETKLIRKAKKQIFRYVARSEVHYAGLTDGDRWMFYRVDENQTKESVTSPIVDVFIKEDNTRECVKILETLREFISQLE